MFNRKTPDASNSLIDRAAATADVAVEGMHDVGDRAGAMARHGMDVVRDTSRKMGHGAQKATDYTVAYVRDEPVKAILMTAVVAAGLISIFRLFVGPGRLR